MSTMQVKIPSQSEDVPSDSTAETPLEPKASNPGQDFLFAVKLFGIAGLVIFMVWLLNWSVS